ncbi:MAG TPA: hypothetical protein VF490_16870, partial [Chryseosolibacter sp.]
MMSMLCSRVRLYFFPAFFIIAIGPTSAAAQQQSPAFLQYLHSPWVDSVMSQLTPDERIAQLIMVAAFSNRGPEHQQQIMSLVRDKKVGGLV